MTTGISRAHGQARHEVLSVLPERAHDLARLQVLADGGAPVVTVIGKYNHGKSFLLNELLGHQAFAVADRRETVTLAGCERNGVLWLDAPGIDADVGSEDDRLALEAAWLRSDIRLFVHAAKEGELDAGELALLRRLSDDARRTRRQTLLVLTQVDQVADDAALRKVTDAIGAQVPGEPRHLVSSTRHRAGLDGGKRLMLERSGLPVLCNEVATALGRVADARRHEARLLVAGIDEELRQLRAQQASTLAGLQQAQALQRRRFDEGMQSLLARLGAQLRTVVDAPGPDHARTVDSAKDHYRQTAAKRERARIQVAYSRACIELDAFLVMHGVIGVPVGQQTGVRAMDSVMVAVMGVSVKLRDDVRRMFCESDGMARLHAAFARYFGQSRDRIALAGEIADAERAIAATGRALAALQELDFPA